MAHKHSHTPSTHGKAFAIGITLNIAYVIVEVFYGLSINSSALLADAGHNTSDVLSLVLAWAATWAAQKRPSGDYTYGYRKTTIMASVINGALIIAAGGIITYDAILKLQNPVEIPGNIIMIVAGIGVVINTLTALLFMKGQKGDLNIKGAFLHMAADAGVSLGVVIGGLVIKLTGITWIDPVLSFVIVAVIVYSAWGLLRDSVKLALDAVPQEIDIQEVNNYLKSINGVEGVHDLHIWAMSTTETALTAHLIVPGGQDDNFLYKIREELHEKFEITHTTLQIENDFGDDAYCGNKKLSEV
ncbi:cation transporter [Christiangramia fulva]|uniref:Cation transporter n=1 Tax=Christiangramia fulva TaxID=2126553 RepID=A0A2R3Z4H7_9FLAO|nr:cation diffusion facilitator family transporter [Christiangramia fulva]AVR45169.1 cation transporter [Christiangramia fulva]